MLFLLSLLFLFVPFVFSDPYPPYPPGCSDTCDYENLTCAHGLFNNTEDCSYWKSSTADDKSGWYALYTCRDCPPGRNGTDCANVINSSVCTDDHQNPYYDGDFVNLNSSKKHWECFVNYDKQGFLSLHDHRVNVTMDLKDGMNGSFYVFSRIWNNSHLWDGWGPINTVIGCAGWQCSGSTSPDNPKVQAQISCAVAHCWGCNKSQGCDPAVAAAANAVTSVQFTLNTMGVYGNGTAYGQITAGGLVLAVQCYTGSCEAGEPDIGFVPYTTYEYLVIIVVGVATVLCLSVAGLAYHANRTKQNIAKKADMENKENNIQESTGSEPTTPLITAETDEKKSTVTMVWKDICYDVYVAQSIFAQKVNRRVLHCVNGYATSGDLVALMGLSGSGKTTLLDILADRAKVGHISGEVVLIKDDEIISRRHSSILSYVPADADTVLLPTQTVYESVYFSAQLRLAADAKGKWTPQRLHKKVMKVLHDLGLDHVAFSRIGMGTDGQGGISTGERKRLSIAMELIVDPLALLMDEPTSGLDSYNATLLMRVLKRAAAERGLLCICSIHQPPSTVYNLFDKLVLLTRKGTCAYSGDADKVLPYLSGNGFDVPDGHVNVAEHLLELSCNKDENIVNRLGDTFKTSKDLSLLKKEMEAASLERGSTVSMSESKDALQWHDEGEEYDSVKISRLKGAKKHHGHTRRVNAGFCTQIILLCARSLSHVWRDAGLLRFTYAFTILAAAALGGLFYNLEDTFGGTQDRAGCLFFLIFFFSLTSLSLLARHLEDKERFLQERERGYYSTLPYMFSKVVCDILPLRVVPPLIFGSICYFLIGLQNEPSRFTTFIVILMLVNVVTSCACFAISAFTSNASTANLIAVIYLVFCMLFGGLFFNKSDGSVTAKYVSYVRYASFFHYGYDALMINEFTNMDFTFSLSGNGDGNDDGDITFTGDFVLSLLAIDSDDFSSDVIGLLAMATGFFLLGFLFLSKQNLARR